jgi:Pentapeptide repeats (8 copies)
METIMGNKAVSLNKGLSISTACLAAAIALVIGIGDANAGARGGGSRAGSSGRMAQSSVSGANRASAGNVNRGNVNTGNVNRGNVNTGNVNRGNVNTGNINVGNDVNIDIDRDYHGGYHGGYYHPIARGAYIGAVAVTTAAVVGAYYYALPPSGCTTVIKNGVSYSYCGTVYYQKIMSGNDVVYVVVNP